MISWGKKHTALFQTHNSEKSFFFSMLIRVFAQLYTNTWQGGGTLYPPCYVFAYICANTRTISLKKLDFSQLWVWKRAVCFLFQKIISFRREKKLSDISKFHKGWPLQAGSNASLPTKYFKRQTLCWKVLGIQTSWILLNMVNHSTSSHFQQELDP